MVQRENREKLVSFKPQERKPVPVTSANDECLSLHPYPSVNELQLSNQKPIVKRPMGVRRPVFAFSSDWLWSTI